MNRRGFLAALGGIAAAVSYDPERLLWVPGRKKIFIPPVHEVRRSMFAVGDRITFPGFPEIYEVMAVGEDHVLASLRILPLALADCEADVRLVPAPAAGAEWYSLQNLDDPFPYGLLMRGPVFCA